MERLRYLHDAQEMSALAPITVLISRLVPCIDIQSVLVRVARLTSPES